MEDYFLILYGAQNLSNDKCISSNAPGSTATGYSVQMLDNAQASGSTVVASKLKSKKINIDGQLIVPSGKSFTFSDLIGDYQRALKDENRFLRITKRWLGIAPISATTNWTAGLDGENITLDAEEYQYNSNSLNFDLDVSNDVANAATLYNASLTQVDLSSYDEDGNFEFWLYIPDCYYIEDIDIRVGNDSSNYWGYSELNRQYDDVDIQNGWNYFSVPWSAMTETGTVDPSAIDYVFIQINYDSSQGDLTDLRFGGMIWQDDDESRNYRSYCEKMEPMAEHYNITSSKFRADFICQSGISIATSEESLLTVTDETGITDVNDIILRGSADQLPIFNFTIDDGDGIASIILNNLSTGENVVVAPSSFVDGDSVIINTQAGLIYQNGSPIHYDGVLPSFKYGVNKIKVDITSQSEDAYEQEVQDTSYGTVFDRIYAQGFTNTNAGILTQVDLYIQKVPMGASGAVHLYLYDDDGGEPGSLICGLGTYATSSTSFVWVSDTMSVSLDAATDYWLVAIINGRSLYGDWFYYLGGSTGDEFAAGDLFYSDDVGSNWTEIVDEDVCFRAYVQPPTAFQYDLDVSYTKRYLE